MRVEVRCFASLRELAQDRCELTLAAATTVEDAWTAMAARHPGLRPHRPYVRAARNGAYAGWDEALIDGDVIAFLPPVSGGATTALVDGPIDVERAGAGGGACRPRSRGDLHRPRARSGG